MAFALYSDIPREDSGLRFLENLNTCVAMVQIKRNRPVLSPLSKRTQICIGTYIFVNERTVWTYTKNKTRRFFMNSSLYLMTNLFTRSSYYVHSLIILRVNCLQTQNLLQ